MLVTNDTEQAPGKGGLLSRLLLILGILLLVVALGTAGFIVWQYADAQNRYSQIQSVAGLEVNIPEAVDSSLQLEDLNFDWHALRELNPDVVGWIIIPGTNVNYPIVQGNDNEYYLYHLFDTTSSGTGSIFADFEGYSTLDGQNNLIYGHNMFDSSMFSDILMYSNQNYFDTHRTVFLCTPERNYELSAVALVNVPENTELRKFYFETQEEFTAYLETNLTSPISAVPNLLEQISVMESAYWLVTCDTFDTSKRIILNCVPVRSEVPANAQQQ